METAAFAFHISGRPSSCAAFGHGHINRTLKITTDSGAEYILQRINRSVFHNPVQLMANAGAVSEHIRARVGDPRGALHFLQSVQGLPYYRDEAGEFWRMYDFVGGFCLDAPESDADFYESALAFGNFQQLLSDFPADTLYETIPRFHDTPDRYRQLRDAMSEDPCGRLREVARDAAFLLQRESHGGTLQRLRERGTLPLRVTHNDTKFNNVLLDRRTRKALCVLDLDTVMPGLSAYDFGDSIRFGAATAAEDTPVPETMGLNLRLYAVYARGFLRSAPALTQAEVDALPVGAYTMTLECAVRFLTDYLCGDTYFKTDYPNHNLVRARSQMALLADMERKFDEMRAVTSAAAAQARRP